MTAEHDGGCGPDALMAALGDEPLADGVRADAAFMAEHRSATADIALLREQLGVLADALTEPEGEPAAQPAPAPVRHLRAPRALRPLALRAVGVAAAAAMVFGAGWAVVHVGPPGASDDAASKSAASDAGEAGEGDGGAGAKASEDAGALLGDPGYLACARLVVEGDVTDVRRLPGTTRERVSLRVTHVYRPAKSAPEVAFEMEQDMDPLLGRGDHVLVALGKGSAVPDVWAVGEPDIVPEREALAQALPDMEAASCG